MRSRTIKDAQDRPIDDTDEIRDRWSCTESLYTKDQTIQAEWLAIPSIVVDPVPAVLPAEVTNISDISTIVKHPVLPISTSSSSRPSMMTTIR